MRQIADFLDGFAPNMGTFGTQPRTRGATHAREAPPRAPQRVLSSVMRVELDPYAVLHGA